MPSLATTSISSFKLARFSRPLRFNDPIVREQPECYSIRPSLIDYIREDLQELSRRLFYQRIYIFAKNKLDVEPPTLSGRQTPTVLPTQGGSYRSARRSVISVTSARRDTFDFKILLQMELQNILMSDIENSISGDKPTGLFLYMGDYTLLMFECVEDIVGSFCNQLSAIADKYFFVNKVFLTEDRTGETYFQNFHYRRAVPININEKFPPNTVTDVELMGQQHLTIKDKLHELCTALSQEIRQGQEAAVHSTLSSNKGTFSLGRASLDFGEDLTPITFNKLLPEVQRIELVLNCNRFYCNVQRRAVMYNRIPGELDEKLHTWPIPYNYTPIGVFWHSPYDVNLTFSDYGKKEEQVQEKGTGSEESEEKGA